MKHIIHRIVTFTCQDIPMDQKYSLSHKKLLSFYGQKTYISIREGAKTATDSHSHVTLASQTGQESFIILMHQVSHLADFQRIVIRELKKKLLCNNKEIWCVSSMRTYLLFSTFSQNLVHVMAFFDYRWNNWFSDWLAGLI